MVQSHLTHKKFALFSSRGGLLVLSLAVLAGSVFINSSSTFGYGYGVATCTGEAPEGIAIQQFHNKRQLNVSWDATTFTDCAQAEPDHYKLDLRTNSGHVVKTYQSLTSTSKTIPSRRLKWNYSYKLRVQAVAVDGATSDWSDYRLVRSTPKAASRLKTIWQAEQLVYISWNNVARSNALRYYQITAWQHNKKVTRKKVHTGLSADRTGVYLRKLQRGERYRITIKSVYSGTVYSKDAELIVQ